MEEPYDRAVRKRQAAFALPADLPILVRPQPHATEYRDQRHASLARRRLRRQRMPGLLTTCHSEKLPMGAASQ